MVFILSLSYTPVFIWDSPKDGLNTTYLLMPVKLKSLAWSHHGTPDRLISYSSFTFSLPKDIPNSTCPKTHAHFPKRGPLYISSLDEQRAPAILETRLAPFQADTFPCAIHHESLLVLLPQCLSNSPFLLLHLRSSTRAPEVAS